MDNKEKPQLQLDQWQQTVLDHNGNLLLCSGRQCGKTTIFARKAADYMLNHKNSRIIVVSLTEDQAKLMIIMIITYLEQNHNKEIQKAKAKTNTTKITLKNGSYVISRPVGTTGDAVRGFTGDVLIVDEAAGMSKIMWAGAKPSLASMGGQIWMCSTPRGKTGYFYDCYVNKHNRFKVVEINTVDVYKDRKISEIWTKQRKKEAMQFVEEERKDMSELEFSQEYLGMFMEDVQQLFPDELIRARMIVKRPEIIGERESYIGIDIGRLGDDPSAYEIVSRNGDHLTHIEHQMTHKQMLTMTAQHIINLDKQYDFNKIYPDSEGIGIGVLDILLTDPQTRRKTEGLKNSTKVIDYKNDKKTRLLKQDLYMNLLALMERGHIDLLTDPDIFTAFKSVQYEFTTDKTGKPFIHIFSSPHSASHLVEALVRAAWCIKSKGFNMWVDYI